MNKTSLLSLLAVLIFIAAAVFSATHPRNLAYTNPETTAPEIPAVNAGSDVMPSTPGIAMDSLAMVTAAQNQVSGSSAPIQANNLSDPRVFWVKVAFSAVFCLAALYVVLSGKYDAETKKWAFSVLTLIAGVWIGSVI